MGLYSDLSKVCMYIILVFQGLLTWIALSDLMFVDRDDVHLSSFLIIDNLFKTVCIVKVKAKLFV